ncbi:MAG: hypothetical protein IJ168_04640 [Eubacterium sp.]|nr:hypothetical protein [Eubacterium sp.]
MLKGVNKQILEVTNTESPYFEKIIFFVRPQGQQLSEKALRGEAEKLAQAAGKPPRARIAAGQRLATAAFILLGIGAGIALTFLMNMLV